MIRFHDHRRRVWGGSGVQAQNQNQEPVTTNWSKYEEGKQLLKKM